METLKNITLYKCDHCSKTLKRKHAMVNHEIKCKSNPNNIKACFDCKYMSVVDIEYYSGFEWDDSPHKSTSFKCIKKDVFMYPPKMEHSERGVPEIVTHEGEEISQEKMPVECKEFKVLLFD